MQNIIIRLFSEFYSYSVNMEIYTLHVKSILLPETWLIITVTENNVILISHLCRHAILRGPI